MEDGYSGFTVYDLEADADQPTELDRILRDQGIERTIVVGVATDVCVRATALDAAKLGYVTEVIPEATAAVDQEEGDGERSLEEMADHGIAIVSAAT